MNTDRFKFRAWDRGCYCCFPFGTLEAALPYCKIIGNIYEGIQE